MGRRADKTFLLVWALIAIARLLLLYTTQRHVYHDEAVIGLMGKHILEGRYFPFYVYNPGELSLAKPYNAGAAWEAYLAACSFAVFGVGVIPLKICVVTLSLVTVALFYRLSKQVYGPSTGLLATLVFAASPSLMRWSFQVRGYSWYFIFIPILLSLFFSIDSDSRASAKKILLLGLVSGLSQLALELALTLIAALWFLLVVRGRLSFRTALAGLAGFLTGYAPAIIFNFTHDYSNWRCVFTEKTSSGVWLSLLNGSTLPDILLREMPKFFSSETVFWYYPEISAWGVWLYIVALLALAVAVFPFLKQPSKIWSTLRNGRSEEGRDLLLLVLILACLIPYLASPRRVPSYFLGACFPLSLLTGRLLGRGPRRLSGFLLSSILLIGVVSMMTLGGQMDALLLVKSGDQLLRVPTRVPGQDVETVEEFLRAHQISQIQATEPFLYPLQFESGETLAVSDPIFGWERLVYTHGVPQTNAPPVFVIESQSPFYPVIVDRFTQMTGAAPKVSTCGGLSVIESVPR